MQEPAALIASAIGDINVQVAGMEDARTIK
jgi:hypothetical protein